MGKEWRKGAGRGPLLSILDTSLHSVYCSARPLNVI